MLQTRKFDCILMDVQMPVMSGLVATREIRRLELNAETSASAHARKPIIALTAYAMAGDREKFLEAGMDGYLAKPVKMEDLDQVLDQVLHQVLDDSGEAL